MEQMEVKDNNFEDLFNEVLHYPRLDTILNIEKLLKKSSEPISRNEIMKRLEKKIMRQTLNVVLNYLDYSGKTINLKEGILWVFKKDSSQKLRKLIDEGISV